MKKIISLISLLILTFHGAGAQQLEVSDVAGCYRVEFRHWPEGAESLHGPGDFAKQVQLTAEEQSTPFDWKTYELRVLRRAEGPYDVTPLRWDLLDDEIRVRYAPAFAGIHLRLKVSDDSLYGLGIAFTDSAKNDNPWRAEGSVTLYPMKCPEGQ